MAKYLLGTDNGGTLAKAALFDTEGRQLAVARMVKIDRVQEPGPGLKGVYAEKAVRYQKALDTLGPLWPELA